ncbi:hypothetical protein OPV22_000582 [Ensete ventricosum]|uniref:Uncharacterized protein n=1 Tax=Ensete ventricosum TaxID=4639 RepID=A0A426XXJ4_ENSVE|nr:hypothetical protein OPV22_000582 [Ensete ventricosum]RRT44080.1 hypothetical protein B296_00026287 [Ensete ventricosum]
MAGGAALFAVLVCAASLGHALGGRLGGPDRMLAKIPESPWLEASNKVAVHDVDDDTLNAYIPESPWMDVPKDTGNDYGENPRIPETPWSAASTAGFGENPRIPETPWRP